MIIIIKQTRPWRYCKRYYKPDSIRVSVSLQIQRSQFQESCGCKNIHQSNINLGAARYFARYFDIYMYLVVKCIRVIILVTYFVLNFY